jgi:lysophospholipase L1-like esterase
MSVLFYLIALALPVLLALFTLVFFRREQEIRARSRVLSLLTGNALLIALCISLGFAFGETYYRFIYDTTDSFASTLTALRWMDRHYEFNNWGVRDNIDYEARMAEGARRVTFLGDSFTQGYGIADVEHRFVNLIRKHDRSREVHDLSSAGATTETEINILRDALDRGYELETVVLVYCLNDASEITPEWRHRYGKLYSDFWPDNFLVRNSYFANTLFFRYKRKRNPDAKNYFHFLRYHYRGRSWDAQELLFYRLYSLVRQNGGQLRVVIFPFFHNMGPEYPYADIHEKLAAFWEGLGVPTLDLLGVYREYSSDELVVNQYDAHPNGLAHRLAADEITRFLSGMRENADAPNAETSPADRARADR